MLSLVQKCLVVMVLVLLPLSCTKIDEQAPAGQGNVAIETLPVKNSIPLEWGNLVSVTVTPEAGAFFQLWFQDEQGNLRLVLYHARTNSLMDIVRFIPRK
jgi:hypothetical protein